MLLFIQPCSQKEQDKVLLHKRLHSMKKRCTLAFHLFDMTWRRNLTCHTCGKMHRVRLIPLALTDIHWNFHFLNGNPPPLLSLLFFFHTAEKQEEQGPSERLFQHDALAIKWTEEKAPSAWHSNTELHCIPLLGTLMNNAFSTMEIRTA